MAKSRSCKSNKLKIMSGEIKEKEIPNFESEFELKSSFEESINSNLTSESEKLLPDTNIKEISLKELDLNDFSNIQDNDAKILKSKKTGVLSCDGSSKKINCLFNQICNYEDLFGNSLSDIASNINENQFNSHLTFTNDMSLRSKNFHKELDKRKATLCENPAVENIKYSKHRNETVDAENTSSCWSYLSEYSDECILNSEFIFENYGSLHAGNTLIIHEKSSKPLQMYGSFIDAEFTRNAQVTSYAWIYILYAFVLSSLCLIGYKNKKRHQIKSKIKDYIFISF